MADYTLKDKILHHLALGNNLVADVSFDVGKHKRIEKPYMARQKNSLFSYNINLGIVDQLKEEDLCRILLKMCRGNSTDE